MQSIQKIIKTDLQHFNEKFVASMQTYNLILEAVVENIFQQKGKQLRPTLVILAA